MDDGTAPVCPDYDAAGHASPLAQLNNRKRRHQDVDLSAAGDSLV